MKKFLGLFAVALISVCFITGCGNDKNDSMTDTTSQTSQTSNTQETSKSMTENGEVPHSDGIIEKEKNETGNSGSDMMDDIEDGIEDIMGDGDNNDSDTVTNPSDTVL